MRDSEQVTRRHARASSGWRCANYATGCANTGGSRLIRRNQTHKSKKSSNSRNFRSRGQIITERKECHFCNWDYSYSDKAGPTCNQTCFSEQLFCAVFEFPQTRKNLCEYSCVHRGETMATEENELFLPSIRCFHCQVNSQKRQHHAMCPCKFHT